MASCEKCWRDSNGNPDEYHRLIGSRYCTPEEQAGEDATICPKCNKRTVHQYAKVCMISNCDYKEIKP